MRKGSYMSREREKNDEGEMKYKRGKGRTSERTKKWGEEGDDALGKNEIKDELGL